MLLLCLGLLALMGSFAWSDGSQTLSTPAPPPGDGPTEVRIEIDVNKIVAIREVDETYTLDGYLRAIWSDQRLAKPADDARRPYEAYLDDNAGAVLGSRIWWPYFEFINTIGKREIQNRRLRLYPDGRVIYTERFRATFASEMDFRQYPFDKQYFTISIESYPYDTGTVVFKHDDDEVKYTAEPIEEWKVEKLEPRVEERCFTEVDGEHRYSRFTLGVVAKRKPDYFYYQFFLPLLLIIGSSWIIFWLRSFSDQLTIAFTLMLTVVAFNFFTSTLLPRLPYNTFIETAVLSGYLSIFAAIVVVVVHQATESRFGRVSDRLFAACRWLFPLVYLCVAALVSLEMIVWPEWTAPPSNLRCVQEN